jgi:hypothetical protein
MAFGLERMDGFMRLSSRVLALPSDVAGDG